MEVSLLTNMHEPQVEVMHQYLCVVEFTTGTQVLLIKAMANSHSTSGKTLNSTKKQLFHSVDLSILNAVIIHSSCVGIFNHKVFQEQAVNHICAAQDLKSISSTLGCSWST
jgi:hypothetical protein